MFSHRPFSDFLSPLILTIRHRLQALAPVHILAHIKTSGNAEFASYQGRIHRVGGQGAIVDGSAMIEAT
ncbi:carbohydrate esterase family 4 protein [Moniliophthora roreri]|nr:carbohydrate esterase family 4 protein [Moniliophthora roreri]